MDMKRKQEPSSEKVLVSPAWWNSVQTDLQDAIADCNKITSSIAAHQIEGKHDAEELLDRIDGQVRQIRKLIEANVTPI
jgi:flagellar hook-associated protein FlgK